MAKVSNLTVQKQSGNDNVYYATWEFNETQKNTTIATGAIVKGDLVSIKSTTTTYYNGVAMPSWVRNDRWYVIEVYGNRAVLGKNASGTHNIISPVRVSDLISTTTSTPSTTTINTLDHYEVKWYYWTDDGVWFVGNSSNVTEKQSTYSPPDGSSQIKCVVTPVSKTRKVNNQDTSYWSGTATSFIYYMAADPPEVPAVPTVEIEDYSLTASIENVSDPRTDQIQFQVYNGTKLVKTATVTVVTCQAIFEYTVSPGGEYRVRCRSVNLYNNNSVYSEWSDFSSTVNTIPAPPEEITVCRASSETSVYLEWTEAGSAETYDIEYTTELRYFDGSNQTITITGAEFTHYEVTGIESGDEYFFRVRAVNEQGESAWTEPKSVIIGEKPSAPTTWSSTTTAITGDLLTLYWVHNARDGSKMTYAELEMYIGERKETYTIEGYSDDEEPEGENKTHIYIIDTSEYKEGTKIRWRVRTAGITKVYGDWSVQRTVDIYAPPTLELTLTDSTGTQIETLTSFPLNISALAGPKTQAPIGYYVSIIANETYQTTDSIGKNVIINVGDEVYSQYFDMNEPLYLSLSANDIDLENNISYTITCISSMDSGLNGQASLEFDVYWTDVEYEPDAEISFDSNAFVAYIRPYCINEEGYLIENVTLSVYRREFDGSFTELSKNIDNAENLVIVDPHPSLDYARYRIIATDKNTGTISFYDPPGYPIGESAIIIQWDEEWSDFDTTNEDAMEQSPWNGSILRLPYNIDISDTNTADVSLVEYAGRRHPVSYYGTQIGATATWNLEIVKKDVDTLYGLRRLAAWMGDVYVREPSGSGYWANVAVSFSQKHTSLTIPVTLNLTRVEGGA